MQQTKSPDHPESLPKHFAIVESAGDRWKPIHSTPNSERLLAKWVDPKEYEDGEQIVLQLTGFGDFDPAEECPNLNLNDPNLPEHFCIGVWDPAIQEHVPQWWTYDPNNSNLRCECGAGGEPEKCIICAAYEEEGYEGILGSVVNCSCNSNR